MKREAWTRDERTCLVDVRDDGTVILAVEVLRQMLADLGYEPVTGAPCEVCESTGTVLDPDTDLPVDCPQCEGTGAGDAA